VRSAFGRPCSTLLPEPFGSIIAWHREFLEAARSPAGGSGRLLPTYSRRLHKASGLADRLRLAFTDCLGPCSEANVMLLYLRGQSLWFRRMNAPDVLGALLACARGTADGDAPPPGRARLAIVLLDRVGLGPEPPIADAQPQQGAV